MSEVDLKTIIEEDIVKSERYKSVNLDLGEVIDIIAQGYKIETMPFIGNYNNDSDILGLHIDNGTNLEILINSEQSKEERNYTILHECYHALFRKYSLPQIEKRVDELAVKTYKQLYHMSPPFIETDESENHDK
jgi:Zn-dependent peptidase ImmA (M78 family)